MNRITKKFQTLAGAKEKALIAYLTAGRPSLAQTGELILAMEEAGADIIEIGVPFSDPTADGPIIQQASRQALKGGTNLRLILDVIEELRQKTEIPLVLFSYYNPIYAYGLKEFAERAKEAGIDAILVVDLPPEEAQELRCHTDPAGIAFIPLIAPTTSEERARRITQGTNGFLYLVSVTGVTGTSAPALPMVEESIARIRKVSQTPLAVGFGISTPAQAKQISPLCDGIVVGSAIVELIERYENEPELLEKIQAFIREMKKGIAPF